MRIFSPSLILLAGSSCAQQWTQLPDFPGTARDDAATFSYGCNVYVGTGMEVGWSLTNDWWRYNVDEGQWYPVAALPASPRQYATASQLYGTGFLFGGIDASGPLNECWRYDILTNAWEQRASLPSEGRYACASFAAGGRMYVVGGLLANGSASSEVWAYDLFEDSWEQVADLPGVARHRAAAHGEGFDLDSYGFVLGGADEEYNALDNFFWYDVTTGSWNDGGTLPEARFGAAVGLVNDLVIIGGQLQDGSFTPTSWETDFSDEWTAFAEDLPSGRRGGVGSFFSNGSCGSFVGALYGLGLDNNLVRHKDWYQTGTWTSVDELNRGQLRSWPNPVSRELHLDMPNGARVAYASIYDASGVLVHHEEIRGQEPLVVGSLEPGAYSISVAFGLSHANGRFIKLP